MSLASDYAAAQSTVAAAEATALSNAPPSFSGPNGIAEVTIAGNLRITQTTTGVFEIPPAAALAFAAWIQATFA